jgi:hypothetical protein
LLAYRIGIAHFSSDCFLQNPDWLEFGGYPAFSHSKLSIFRFSLENSTPIR